MPPAKLCCIAEQRSGSTSPDLPNARISPATPAKRPLLQNKVHSYSSRVTSTRSEDMRELQQIFIGATGGDSSPTRRGSPLRDSTSAQNVHKIKSMGALIKKKLSRELSRSRSKSTLPSGSVHVHKRVEGNEQGTVVKLALIGANQDVKITNEDLKKNLLSDRGPDEGGYDDDALELDDVVKNLGRKTPTRRPSIHSVEWTTPSSKESFGSSRPRHFCSSRTRGNQPYQISKYTLPSSLPSSPSVYHFPSSPSLKVKWKLKARQLRRSQSETSVEIPPVPALQPIRLPSISSIEAMPWSLAMTENLHLLQFPSPPSVPVSNELERKRSMDAKNRNIMKKRSFSAPSRHNSKREQAHPNTDDVFKRSITETMVQEPVKASSEMDNISQHMNNEGHAGGRDSVHLYDMRISRHLRSASVLSSATSMNTPQQTKHVGGQPANATLTPVGKRQERKTSSSGFASNKIPSAWGTVIKNDPVDHRDESSSIYSSRPQSPHDSVKKPTVNIGAIAQASNRITMADATSATSINRPKNSSKTYISQPPGNTTNVSKPGNARPQPYPASRPSYDPFVSIFTNEDTTITDNLLDSLFLPTAPFATASVNSSQTSLGKKSRFREDFSLSPPRKTASKRLTAVSKFLNRTGSMITRSNSISNFFVVDGPSDEIDIRTQDKHLTANPKKLDKKKEHRFSRSLVSLKTEQDTLSHHHHDSSPMWERALKQYQEERSTMFLSPSVAASTSPFRERSESSTRRPSVSNASNRTRPSLPSTNEEGVPLELGTPSSPGYSPAFLPMPSGSSFSRVTSEVDWDRGRLDDLKKRMFEGPEDKKALGAWAQYPSHTRELRGGSAGLDDAVLTRDFALEASNIGTKVMKPPERMATMFSVQNVFSTTSPSKNAIGEDDREGSPTRARKKEEKVVKSHSMTFGKTFLKNYGRLFRSSSSDFRKHGHGHRSSIAGGGVLEYPELEILPEVFAGCPRSTIAESVELMPLNGGRSYDVETSEEDGGSKDKAINRNTDTDGSADEREALLDGSADVFFDSAEHIPLPATPAEPNPIRAESSSAHLWSRFYASCVEYPRNGTSFDDIGIRDERVSTDLADSPTARRRGYSKSETALCLTASGNTDNAEEKRSSSINIVAVKKPRSRKTSASGRSTCSVRKSTVDLVTEFMTKELLERENIARLVRVDSGKGMGMGTGVGLGVGVEVAI